MTATGYRPTYHTFHSRIATLQQYNIVRYAVATVGCLDARDTVGVSATPSAVSRWRGSRELFFITWRMSSYAWALALSTDLVRDYTTKVKPLLAGLTLPPQYQGFCYWYPCLS